MPLHIVLLPRYFHPRQANPSELRCVFRAAYLARLAARLRRDLFTPAAGFDRGDGLYLYKRPVQSASSDKAALLASAGTVFHHVVIYVKQGQELTALEMGPANEMDITDNLLAEALPGPLLLRPAPQPDPRHLPMLHVAAPHHALDARHVRQALQFAGGTMYHALRNNCICFADFVVRVLTGGAVRGAPLIFDALVGQVPVADSPLLALLELTMQMSWHDVCDGSRLLHAFLRQHPAGLPPPPAGSEALSILVEPAVPAEAGSETATETVAASAAPALPTLSALLGLLAPGALQAAGPGLSPLLAPASAPVPAVRPADSSSDSDVTVGGVERREETETDLAVPSPPSPSLGASLAAVSSSASTGSNGRARAGVRGLGLPPRKLKAAAGSAAGRG
ncbi:expressed protein [Chlorella variabilis]|uniref:Expressed protein n=1 Tax=Chlorella variabilis TaxID=554065 RepID=E1ZBY8_CHLVA|nr:expressed protein [Chlorella variabilis]EFN56517.1 expressed protein [Chlorella variabilis]|eukprot:XP_005848619.1 expressed protein [Chlorella variabilis]